MGTQLKCAIAASVCTSLAIAGCGDARGSATSTLPDPTHSVWTANGYLRAMAGGGGGVELCFGPILPSDPPADVLSCPGLKLDAGDLEVPALTREDPFPSVKVTGTLSADRRVLHVMELGDVPMGDSTERTVVPAPGFECVVGEPDQDEAMMAMQPLEAMPVAVFPELGYITDGSVTITAAFVVAETFAALCEHGIDVATVTVVDVATPVVD